MDIYKITVRGANKIGYVRTRTLLVEAETPDRAEEICMGKLAEDDGFRFPHITKTVLHHVQTELLLDTEQPTPAMHKKYQKRGGP